MQACHFNVLVQDLPAPLWIQFPVNTPRKTANGDPDLGVTATHIGNPDGIHEAGLQSTLVLNVSEIGEFTSR